LPTAIPASTPPSHASILPISDALPRE